MEDAESLTERLARYVSRWPVLQYALVTGLGVIGVLLALPIGLQPASRLEWVDLVINFLILVPSVALISIGGVLTAASTFAPSLRDPDARTARLARVVLRTIGIPQSALPGLSIFGPLGLLVQIFLAKDAPEEIAGPSDVAPGNEERDS